MQGLFANTLSKSLPIRKVGISGTWYRVKTLFFCVIISKLVDFILLSYKIWSITLTIKICSHISEHVIPLGWESGLDISNTSISNFLLPQTGFLVPWLEHVYWFQSKFLESSLSQTSLCLKQKFWFHVHFSLPVSKFFIS